MNCMELCDLARCKFDLYCRYGCARLTKSFSKLLIYFCLCYLGNLKFQLQSVAFGCEKSRFSFYQQILFQKNSKKYWFIQGPCSCYYQKVSQAQCKNLTNRNQGQSIKLCNFFRKRCNKTQPVLICIRLESRVSNSKFEYKTNNKNVFRCIYSNYKVRERQCCQTSCVESSNEVSLGVSAGQLSGFEFLTDFQTKRCGAQPLVFRRNRHRYCAARNVINILPANHCDLQWTLH